MSFRGCSLADAVLGIIAIYIANGSTVLGEDGPTEISYSVYVGENGAIMRSSGETNIIFEQKTSGTTQRLNHVRVTPFGYDSTVIAVGNNGTIVRSTNTGNTWSVSTPATSANLYGTDFNSTYSYAVGDNGTLVYSFDHINWSPVPSGTTRNLKAISLSNQFGSIVVAVGEKGAIVRSTNSGQDWTNVSLADTAVNFYDISRKGLYYNDGNKFCIVGTGGRIYKSTDGGATWVQKTSGTTNTLRSIYFHTVDSAVVVGDNGTIRLTTDGGETWFTDSYFNSPSTRHFKSVSLVNRDHHTFSALSDTLWFVSQDPISLTAVNEPASSEIPDGFSLSQNYPNPFNPSTEIRYQIAEDRHVTLKVFDVLGKEVAALVDQNLNAGSYATRFDAINLANGVYFYRLQAGSFSQTKKMLLAK